MSKLTNVLQIFEDFTNISQKARNQTRRGLERVSIKRELFTKEIREQAFEVYKDNTKRLNVFKNEKLITRRWYQWSLAIESSQCCEFWCAYHAKELVAFTLLLCLCSKYF